MVLLFLVLIAVIKAQLFTWPAPLLPVLMDDLKISYAHVGFLLNLMGVLMPLAMLCYSFFLSRISCLNLLIVSSFCFLIDGGIVLLSHSYESLLIGRFFTGIGYGFGSSAFASLAVSHFSPSQRGFLNSINIIAGSIGTTVTYTASVPLYHWVSSWRTAVLIWALPSIILIACILFAKHRLAIKDLGADPTRFSLSNFINVLAMKRMWLLALAYTGVYVIQNCYTTYLPAFLSEIYEKNYSAASWVSSILTISGMAGCLFCGLIMSRAKGTKLLMCGLSLAILSASIGVSLLHSLPLTYLCIAVLGFSNWAFPSVCLTTMMNIPGITPLKSSIGMLFLNSVSGIATAVMPFPFDALESNFGMRFAFFVFSLTGFLILIPSIVFKGSNTSA